MHETLALDEWYCAVACMVWEGLDAVRTARKMLGETRPLESLPGTIRGDFCLDVGYGAARSRMRSADRSVRFPRAASLLRWCRRNVCHGSDSVEAAEREIGVWFEPGALPAFRTTATAASTTLLNR